MSNAQKFIDAISQNAEMKAKCLQLYMKKDEEGIEKLSHQVGYPCNYQDLLTIFKERTFSKKLTDEDLLRLSAAQGGDKYH